MKLFEKIEHNVIVATVITDDANIERVALKYGFVQTGVVREAEAPEAEAEPVVEEKVVKAPKKRVAKKAKV